jgi:hypothetical protein
MPVKTVNTTVYECDWCGKPIAGGMRALLISPGSGIIVGGAGVQFFPNHRHDEPPAVMCVKCVPIQLAGAAPSKPKETPHEAYYEPDAPPVRGGPASGRPCTTEAAPGGVSSPLVHGGGSWS